MRNYFMFVCVWCDVTWVAQRNYSRAHQDALNGDDCTTKRALRVYSAYPSCFFFDAKFLHDCKSSVSVSSPSQVALCSSRDSSRNLGRKLRPHEIIASSSKGCIQKRLIIHRCLQRRHSILMYYVVLIVKFDNIYLRRSVFRCFCSWIEFNKHENVLRRCWLETDVTLY